MSRNGSQQTKVRPESIKVIKSEDRLFRNPRLTFKKENLESTKKSIIELGLLSPLLVKKIPNSDDFELIAGERRLKIIIELKRENATCMNFETTKEDKAQNVYEFVEVKIFSPTDDSEMLKIAIAENMEHSPVPEWDYLQLALDLDNRKNEAGEKTYHREKICSMFNKSQAWLSHTLSLATLPEPALKRFKDGSLSRTAAIQLLSAKPEKIPEVLEEAEKIVKQEAINEILKANETTDQAELEVEIAEAELKSAKKTGEVLAAKVASKNIKTGKKKVSAASSKRKSAENRVANPAITGEAVNRVLDSNPEAIKPKAKKKVRSAKQLRQQVEEIKSLLEKEGDDIVEEETGQKVSRRDVNLILAVYEQILGKKSISIFKLLKELAV